MNLQQPAIALPSLFTMTMPGTSAKSPKAVFSEVLDPALAAQPSSASQTLSGSIKPPGTISTKPATPPKRAPNAVPNVPVTPLTETNTKPLLIVTAPSLAPLESSLAPKRAIDPTVDLSPTAVSGSGAQSMAAITGGQPPATPSEVFSEPNYETPLQSLLNFTSPAFDINPRAAESSIALAPSPQLAAVAPAGSPPNDLPAPQPSSNAAGPAIVDALSGTPAITATPLQSRAKAPPAVATSFLSTQTRGQAPSAHAFEHQEHLHNLSPNARASNIETSQPPILKSPDPGKAIADTDATASSPRANADAHPTSSSSPFSLQASGSILTSLHFADSGVSSTKPADAAIVSQSADENTPGFISPMQASDKTLSDDLNTSNQDLGAMGAWNSFQRPQTPTTATAGRFGAELTSVPQLATEKATPLPAAYVKDLPNQSEMHVGLHTPMFGSVEVHTVVRESQVGITIGSERGELPKFLAPEMPVLASRLQQHDLHLDSVRFLNAGATFGGGFSSGADPRSRPSPETQPRPPQVAPEERGKKAGTAEPAIWVRPHAGLNERA